MKTLPVPTWLMTLIVFGTLVIIHSATPMGVSAQATATMTASANVVHADAAWTGVELTHAVVAATVATDRGAELDPALRLASGPATSYGAEAIRMERNGTVVWVEASRPDRQQALVTVAHLGS